MLGPDAALETAYSSACNHRVELTQPSLQSVENHELQEFIATRFEAVGVIQRNALTCWEQSVDLLKQSCRHWFAAKFLEEHHFLHRYRPLSYIPGRAPRLFHARRAAAPREAGRLGARLGARLGPIQRPTLRRLPPGCGRSQRPWRLLTWQAPRPGPGSLQNASGCITSAHLRACTKPVGTMVGFALFGGHRGVAQGRPAGRIGPWTVATSRIRCYRTMSPPPGTQLTGCFGNEVGYARPQSGRAIGQATHFIWSFGNEVSILDHSRAEPSHRHTMHRVSFK